MAEDAPSHVHGHGHRARGHGPPWWNLGLPRLVFSSEIKAIHDRTDRVERFNEDTRLLVLDQAWWSANPLGMLWPEMDAAFLTSGDGGRLRRGAQWL
jgi:hypothetical protein